jgi:hypothetical protein
MVPENTIGNAVMQSDMDSHVASQCVRKVWTIG